jgi:hypothetical protein
MFHGMEGRGSNSYSTRSSFEGGSTIMIYRYEITT